MAILMYKAGEYKMSKINNKFIYISDEELYNKLFGELVFIGEMNKDNQKVYVFENNNKLTFSEDIDMSKISYGNVLFI